MRAVMKIGTSSLTDEHGEIDADSVARAASQVAEVRASGHELIVVSSGAVAAGMPALGWRSEDRPSDARTLQAVSAVGQARLVQVWAEQLRAHGLVAGQVLLAPLDFMVRTQYLHARSTLERLLELGVVPIVNENDAIADDEIRFGDNDRIAALVAQLLGAELLVLLTDAPGLMDADPRLFAEASLIEEIVEIDQELERLAGGSGSARGSGGMASKLAAAKMASWGGVRCLIAAAGRDGVVPDALAGRPGVGTWVAPHDRRLPARKLWIAFALPAEGRVVIDDGAVTAITRNGRSLLPAGVIRAEGAFSGQVAVEITDRAGRVVAKGLSALDAATLNSVAGKPSTALPEGVDEVVHRDDLVVMPR